MDFPAANPEFPRRIQLVRVFRKARAIAPESDVARSSKNAFVRGKPAEAQFRGDVQSLVGNGAFRRPQSRRRRAESLLVIATRAKQLFLRVFGKTERRDERRRVRIRDARDLRITQQRQYRVVERRSRDFDLPSFSGGAVLRQYTRD